MRKVLTRMVEQLERRALNPFEPFYPMLREADPSLCRRRDEDETVDPKFVKRIVKAQTTIKATIKAMKRKASD